MQSWQASAHPLVNLAVSRRPLVKRAQRMKNISVTLSRFKKRVCRLHLLITSRLHCHSASPHSLKLTALRAATFLSIMLGVQDKNDAGEVSIGPRGGRAFFPIIGRRCGNKFLYRLFRHSHTRVRRCMDLC